MEWKEVLQFINDRVENEQVLMAVGRGYGISVNEPLQKTYRPITQTTASGIKYYAASNRNASTAALVFERVQKAIAEVQG